MKVKIIKIIIYITEKWEKLPTTIKLLSLILYVTGLVILLF